MHSSPLLGRRIWPRCRILAGTHKRLGWLGLLLVAEEMLKTSGRLRTP